MPNKLVVAKRFGYYKQQHWNILSTFSLRLTCLENKKVIQFHQEVRLHQTTR